MNLLDKMFLLGNERPADEERRDLLLSLILPPHGASVMLGWRIIKGTLCENPNLRTVPEGSIIRASAPMENRGSSAQLRVGFS